MFLSVLLSLLACQTTKGGKVSYNLFYTPADHIAELVAKQQFDDASTVYGQNKDWFVEKMADPAIADLVNTVSTHLQSTYRSVIQTKMRSIKDLEWPSSREKWIEIKTEIEQFSREIHTADGVQIFKDPQFHPAFLDEAKEILNTQIAKIKNSASEQFASYPIFEEENFFNVYPVELDASAFLTEQKVLLEKEIAQAKGNELLNFYKQYEEYLADDAKRQIGGLFFKSLCPSTKKAALATLMGAYAKTCKAGLELDAIPDVKVAFLEVTSDALKEKGGIEFPVGVDLDMPFTAINGSLKKGFDNKEVKSADIIILFNLAATKTNRHVETSNYIKSTCLTGYKQALNPEWDVLQVELQQANMEIMTSNNRLDTSSGNIYKVLGNSIANLLTESKQNKAKQKIEDLKTKFRETPRYVDEPVYGEYAFQRAEMEVIKTGTVQYYVIDQRTKRYLSDFFDVHSQEFFTVAYGLSDTDPNLETLKNTNVTEEAVDAFESEPVTVKLSELLDHYSGNKAKTKRYSSIAQIRRDVVKNRNVMLASAKKKEFGFDKQKDRRFESVVVVKTATGLGTGFYVTDDIVLTNYHVVEEQKFVELEKWGGLETFGKVIAKDVRLDLALVKVQDRGAPVVFYGKKQLNLAETVEAIGHPLGNKFTLTRGVISTLRKHESIMRVKGKPVMFIQTDTPVNAGNSGGPLFLGNYVIGVNDWGVNKNIAEGLNFSIHYSEVFNFLDDNKIAFKKGN